MRRHAVASACTARRARRRSRASPSARSTTSRGSARASSSGRGHPDGNVAVFRTADDRVFALADRCPHKGGPLSQGIVFGDRVACPLHNWTIELASGSAVAPDQGCARDDYRGERSSAASCYVALGHRRSGRETRSHLPATAASAAASSSSTTAPHHRRARRSRSSGELRRSSAPRADAAPDRGAAGAGRAADASAMRAARRPARARHLGRGARPRCRARSRPAFASTAPTASRSTSPASCSPRTTTSSTSSPRA